LPHLRRAYWFHLLFRVSKRRTVAGVEIAAFLPDAADHAAIEAKTSEAFTLLGEYGHRHLTRVRSLADGVLLLGTAVGAPASWNNDARLIRVSQHFISDPDTKPVHVAAVIVHEATHAWLDHLGFSYTTDRRARIEAICYRAQAAFARRIPGCDSVATEYDMCADLVLSQPVEEWSDAAFRSRAAADLNGLGLPKWLAKLVSRSSSVLPNDRCG
jgi:hypothetical protein